MKKGFINNKEEDLFYSYWSYAREGRLPELDAFKQKKENVLLKKLDKIWDKQESRVSKIWSDFSHLFNFFQKNFSVHDPDEYENEYISREEKVIVNMEKAQKKIFEKIRQLRPNLEDEVNCAQQKYIEERHQIFLKNYNIEK